MDSQEQNLMFPENPSKEECEGKQESAVSSGDKKVVCYIYPIENVQRVASTSASVGEDWNWDNWKCVCDQAARAGGEKKSMEEKIRKWKEATIDVFSGISAGGDNSNTATETAAIASTSGENASAMQPDSVPSSTSTEAFNPLSTLLELKSRYEMLLTQQLQTISQRMEVIVEIWGKLQQLNKLERDFLSSLSSGKNEQILKWIEEIKIQADQNLSVAAANAQGEEERPGDLNVFQNDSKVVQLGDLFAEMDDAKDGESIEEADADDDVNENEGSSSHFEAKGRE